MAYQKKVTTSYGGRLKNSLGGIKTGAIMFAIGTVILFLNEGNYVKTNKTIGEAGKNLISVGNDVSSVDPSLNGKLIHAYAFADTQDVLTDSLFGISERAVGISRKVEYYQYREHSSKETKDKIGGGQETTTTYTYRQAWVSSPVNSSAFEDPSYKNANFVLTQVEDKTERAKDVSFGAYKLPQFIISSINANAPAAVNLSGTELQQWEDIIAKSMTALGKKRDGQMVHVQENVVYFGKSASSPAIGDVRLTFVKTMPADISIIAKVAGDSFEKYIAGNGREFSSVAMGKVSADTMIAREKSANKAFTWFLRILGVFFVVGGLKSLFSILPSLFKVLPFLGKIVGAGVGLVCTIGGGAWSLVIISIAWLFYRPLIGIPMLALAGGGIWFLSKKAKEKAAAKKIEDANGGETQASASVWDCACGHKGNSGKFCAECGKPQSTDWDCACGHKGNSGKFCAECGKPQPTP